MALPRLVYFKARGRAEVIRLALAQAGVEWQEENFQGPEEFAALKSSGRLPFLAVPLWEEDGLRLAQSTAILNHIARHHGLYGKTQREAALVDQAIEACADVRLEIRKLATADAAKRPEVRADLLANVLPRWFGLLEKLLATNQNGKGFLVGEGVTIADLHLYYLLEMARDNGFGAAMEKTPLLRAFMERIAALPKIAAYLASSKRPALTLLPV